MRITAAATSFLIKHVNDQHQLLLSEEESLTEVAAAREEEGLTLTTRQMEQVEAVSDVVQSMSKATQEVRELLEVAVELGLIAGEVDVVGASSDAEDDNGAKAIAAGPNANMQTGMNIDTPW